VRPTDLLRAGLLDGLAVVADGPVAAALAALGADVRAPGADPLDEEATRAAAAAAGRADAIVVDGAAAFGAGGPERLRAALDGAWNQVRAAATAGWIPSDEVPDAGPGGKVVLLAPAPGAGPYAEAARAGLENLARTTSIEWARFGIRPTAVAPGPATAPGDLHGLVAYLVSPAGDYYAGCRFDLR
jgi:NAD(P)-dependent dehydrogenase (short-subunit alcohol dehydrogenase family)